MSVNRACMWGGQCSQVPSSNTAPSVSPRGAVVNRSTFPRTVLVSPAPGGCAVLSAQPRSRTRQPATSGANLTGAVSPFRILPDVLMVILLFHSKSGTEPQNPKSQRGCGYSEATSEPLGSL